MYDDGSVEERVRLVRPMGRETMSVRDFAASHWEPSLHNRFGTLWEREISEVPQFSVSEFHVITGLLLPIWDRLPGENMRVAPGTPCMAETMRKDAHKIGRAHV